jgi:hypothetical protein
MKKLFYLVCAMLIFACTEINENFTEVNTSVAISDTTVNNIDVVVNPPNIDIDITNNFIDSSKSYVVVNQYGDSIYIPISVVNNLIATLNNTNNNTNTVTITNPPTEECVEIPNRPTIFVVNRYPQTGTALVTLSDLPNTMWILQRSPDNVYTIGTGTWVNIDGLRSDLAASLGAKCSSTTYKWRVTNICWNTSNWSDEVIVSTP